MHSRLAHMLHEEDHAALAVMKAAYHKELLPEQESKADPVLRFSRFESETLSRELFKLHKWSWIPKWRQPVLIATIAGLAFGTMVVFGIGGVILGVQFGVMLAVGLVGVYLTVHLLRCICLFAVSLVKATSRRLKWTLRYPLAKLGISKVPKQELALTKLLRSIRKAAASADLTFPIQGDHKDRPKLTQEEKVSAKVSADLNFVRRCLSKEPLEAKERDESMYSKHSIANSMMDRFGEGPLAIDQNLPFSYGNYTFALTYHPSKSYSHRNPMKKVRVYLIQTAYIPWLLWIPEKHWAFFGRSSHENAYAAVLKMAQLKLEVPAANKSPTLRQTEPRERAERERQAQRERAERERRATGAEK